MSTMETSDAQKPVLFNTKQVAEMLSIDSYTLRRWIDEGKITAYKIGHRWLFKKEDIMELLEKHKVPKKQNG